MRQDPTDAERKMWAALRSRRFAGYKFRRQVPMGPYIADFVCFSSCLVIEVDGSQHAGSLRDRDRETWFRSQGFRTLRVWNTEFLTDPTTTFDAISATLERHMEETLS
jgi:very-short-patch-repair endonuclease